MLKFVTFAALAVASIPAGARANSYFTPPIQWEACSKKEFRSWFKKAPPKKLRCGYLEVPLKYQNDVDAKEAGAAKKVRLALTRLPAAGVREGSLLAISGGPGESGINPFEEGSPQLTRLSQSWDIVGYDPRGVGQSTPKINCKLPKEAEQEDLSPEQVDRLTLDACANNTGVDVLKHMGSDEAVNDVDLIRQALGDSKLTAIGFSYGTQIGALYAERFPSTTRALVLDGVVDLEEAKDNFTWQLRQAEGYQNSFERFAAWCAATRQCPLSANKKRANQQYQRLLRKLEARPVRISRNRWVGAGDVISLTTELLLSRQSWPMLAATVRQLNTGAVSKRVKGLFEEAETEGNDASVVINCTDQSSQKIGDDEILGWRKRIREAFPAIDYQHSNKEVKNLCDLWMWRNDVHIKRPPQVPDLPQLLFVAQRYDPTTPWTNARNMASLFRSPLLTVEGDGHTLIFSGESPCADKLAADYLIDPGKKRTDITCRTKRPVR